MRVDEGYEECVVQRTHVDVQVDDLLARFDVVVGRDRFGAFVRLEPLNCRLEGVEPGMYGVEPLGLEGEPAVGGV